MKTMHILLMMINLMALNVVAMGRTPLDETVARRNRCNYYETRRECQSDYDCQWDSDNRYCYYIGDDDRNYCEDIRSPLRCSDTPGCYWSRGSCRSDGGSGGGGGGNDPYPRLCYDLDPYECEQHRPDCHWSTRFNRCVGEDDF